VEVGGDSPEDTAMKVALKPSVAEGGTAGTGSLGSGGEERPSSPQPES
jgi:hypothetical protein